MESLWLPVARQYPDSIGIMYPYVFPQDTDLPIDYDIPAHCTLIYLGEIKETGIRMEQITSVLRDVEFNPTGIVDVDGLELFGKDNDVLVMTLKSSDLDENFQKVSEALSSVGIENASSFSDYNPHITLNESYKGPTIGFTLPTTIGLGTPELWYGEDRFPLG